MTAPLVSIIIPFYNCADYAARAIECTLQQSYTNTELILVDNASDDDTVAVLSHYQSKYPEKISSSNISSAKAVSTSFSRPELERTKTRGSQPALRQASQAW